MEPGYYKFSNGEVLYGTRITGPGYSLTSKDTSKVVDGWKWYDKPPVIELTMPCGCVVKAIILTDNEKTDMDTALATLNTKIIKDSATAATVK